MNFIAYISEEEYKWGGSSKYNKLKNFSEF